MKEHRQLMEAALNIVEGLLAWKLVTPGYTEAQCLEITRLFASPAAGSPLTEPVKLIRKGLRIWDRLHPNMDGDSTAALSRTLVEAFQAKPVASNLKTLEKSTPGRGRTIPVATLFKVLSRRRKPARAPDLAQALIREHGWEPTCKDPHQNVATYLGHNSGRGGFFVRVGRGLYRVRKGAKPPEENPPKVKGKKSKVITKSPNGTIPEQLRKTYGKRQFTVPAAADRLGLNWRQINGPCNQMCKAGKIKGDKSKPRKWRFV